MSDAAYVNVIVIEMGGWDVLCRFIRFILNSLDEVSALFAEARPHARPASPRKATPQNLRGNWFGSLCFQTQAINFQS